MAATLEAGLSLFNSKAAPYNPADLKTLAHYAHETRKDLQRQITLMKCAGSEFSRARSQVSAFQNMLPILASNPAYTELIPQTQDDIRSAERRASFEQSTFDEVKAQVAHLRSLLVAASRISLSICPISKRHPCPAAQSAYVGEGDNIKHRFWMALHPQKESPRRVLDGHKLENHRIAAFRDIPERTASKLGNGHSPLRTVTDIDGITSTTTNSDNITGKQNSWSLLRLRFKERKHEYT
jgi:hypothetical protein